jgi:TetR/AcrR family transcriptional regulator of autoinduction and epiphytic fitness
MQLEPLPDPGEPLDVRVDALVEQRAQLFEAITPTRRAAMLAAASSTTWLRGLARSEAFLRRQISETFVDELAGDADRIAAVDFATSWEAWDALRHSSRRSVSSASAIMRSMVHALLTVA